MPQFNVSYVMHGAADKFMRINVDMECLKKKILSLVHLIFVEAWTVIVEEYAVNGQPPIPRILYYVIVLLINCFLFTFCANH